MSPARLIGTAVTLSALALPVLAAAADSPELPRQGVGFRIDLATVLRLADARSLDILLARERLAEARALHSAAVAQFLPWVSPGIGYRRHDNLIQDVAGSFIDVHKQSYAPGATIAAQVDVGDAVYKSLSSKQQINATARDTEAQRQVSAFTAAQNYFDLLLAQAAAGVAQEALGISTNYQEQIKRAVEAGLAFKGDELRVQVETENNNLTLRRAMEQERVTAARLAQILHLDASVLLIGENTELVPLGLDQTNATLDSYIRESLRLRPELDRDRALIAAAQATSRGARYGPLIPSASAQFFAGGLGGDSDAGSSRFGNQEDIIAGLSWKIGPGGLFDFSRTRAAEAHLRLAELTATKRQDEVVREVVESFTHLQSTKDQIAFASRIVAVAQEGLRLAELRREMAVGVVLENIQAQRDLTRARLDYATAISEFNKAQFALKRAVGNLSLSPQPAR
jgi:outer membrane protein TolC